MLAAGFAAGWIDAVVGGGGLTASALIGGDANILVRVHALETASAARIVASVAAESCPAARIRFTSSTSAAVSAALARMVA